MRRIVLRLLGVGLCTWLEFVVYPGHSYLQGPTQATVPMLERLVNPGFLSRDLVATHPNLEYTVYDEATLFMHQAGRVSIQDSLLGQQIASRAAAVLGILLLALAAGLSESLALAVSACVNLGATLAGPHVMVVELESIPRALAWGPLLLAIGLLAREKPLLAGFAAGVALIYEPAVAAPLCLMLLLALIFDRRLRRLLRPAITVFAVFVLLLANLAQLQPGMVEAQPTFEKISAPFAAVQQFRTPYHWVSLWPRGDMWSYLAIWVCGLWAVARIWAYLNRQARWIFLVLPACGIAGIALSYVLLDRLRWDLVPRVQPAQWLTCTLCLSATACSIAAVKAAQRKKAFETALWLVVPFALPLRAEVLDLFRLAQLENVERLSIAVLLAFLGALLLVRFADRRTRAVSLAIPLLAIVLLRLSPSQKRDVNEQPVAGVAEWVKSNTWGSSMFLFPDLGRSNEPGLFRARSERSVWVDWNGGALVPTFQSFASVWWDRWQHTMQPEYSVDRLQATLPLPIDYYVLTRAHRLAGVKPVFANEKFLVYDANDLRNSVSPLRTAEDR